MMHKFIFTIALLVTTTCVYAIKPDTVYIRQPEQLGLIYKDLIVNTKDGFRIATWFFPAQKTLSEPERKAKDGKKRDYQCLDNSSKPTIIICNGDAGNMSYFQLHLAEAYTNMGYNVVTFDWRGFGKSTPFVMDNNYLCYTEMLYDYEAVTEVVAQQPEVKKGAIVAMGWSTGAYLSMITAYNNPHINAFIGRSLATDFSDLIPLVMKVRNKTKEQLIIPSDFPVHQMPIHIAGTFRKPIFLINGEKDIRTPVWMSEKILNLLPAHVPHELMIVKNAAHGGKEDPMMLDFEHFILNSVSFLHKVLK